MESEKVVSSCYRIAEPYTENFFFFCLITMRVAPDPCPQQLKKRDNDDDNQACCSTSNVILSVLPPPIHMSLKTCGFLTLGMIVPPTWHHL